MARLFGIIGNRPDLAARVLAFETDALRARSKGAPLGWGLGFYQGGEVLMRRRPIDERQEIDVAALAADVRADLVIGHVRYATVGALRTENTHPFRYRQWLFAQTGTVSEFEQVRERLVASVPDFLRSGIRGDTDAEVVFHVFLSFLHDAGRLNDGVGDPELLREALRSSLAVVDGMTAEVGADAARLNLMVSSGDQLVALRRSDAEMRLRVLSGKADADAVIGDDPQLRRKIPELARMHFVIAASDFDDTPPNGRWRPVADCAIVTMSRDEDPRIEAL
jgi:predicted glutamine amidotransferase